MLRKFIKQELIQVLQSLIELHHEGMVGKPEETVYQVLQDCQSAAIDIGNVLEENMEKPEASIQVLEQYCEELYQLSTRVPFSEKAIEELDSHIRKILQNVSEEQEKLLIVFFPYKASMWDSLESIWLAAKEDCRCECMVVPIPYYKLEQETQEATAAYEGTEFPEYVPITDYNCFSLEKMKPDIAYIHNPYDEYNYVTRVYSAYFSKVLKQNVGKLIYVPYYVTGGSVSEHHKYLSVYENMDYMIAQSERFKEGFRYTPYYNKILPFGSPKFDRIINMSRDRAAIPVEWKDKIGEKPVLMLNTSINCFLSEGEAYLKKLGAVFKLFEEERDVVLIWRPHPLLEATIRSLRSDFIEIFQKIKQYFISHEIGIYDTTPDITKTVAISDAYIGESASSVVSLFDVAGKPIFILDNYIYGDFSRRERRIVRFSDAVLDGNRWWIVSMDYSGLFCVKDSKWDEICFMGRTEYANKWTCAHTMIEKWDSNVIVSPYDSLAAEVYSDSKQQYIRISNEQSTDIGAKMFFRYKTSIYYLLTYQNAILEYNMATKKWLCYENVYSELKKDLKVRYAAYMWDASCDGRYIYITSADSNKVLKFDMETKECQTYELGKENERFSGIICDGRFIYMAEANTGEIKCVDRQMRYVCSLYMPESFVIRDYSYKSNVAMAHTKLIDMGEWIVTIPFYGNSMVKIHKETKKSYLLIPEFWREAMNSSNGYRPWARGLAFFAKKVEDCKLLVQRFSDGALAEVNMTDESYSIYYPKMSEETFDKFMEGQDGFEKAARDANFACKENVLFSSKGFLEMLKTKGYSEIRNRQMKSLAGMTANLDGTCGQKVHEFMMKEYGF